MRHLPVKPYSFLHYLRYLMTPANTKTHELITLAKHDPFYAKIISVMEEYGYHVKHRYFGQNGAYIPATIHVAKECVVEDELKAQHAQGKLYASFSFSSRFGGAQIAHYWLHELMHFWQDLHGLLITPLKAKDSLPVMLDAPSHITVTCLCEAMAETESLRASWRLKETGYPIAWQGALSSLDWGKHARAYAKDLQTMPEPEAARCAFDRWYTSTQRPYYEKRALHAYQSTINELNITDPVEMHAQLRRADLDALIQTLPPAERPDYLTNKSLNDSQFTAIRHPQTAKQVQELENQLGVCSNPDFKEIHSGSAAHIWKLSQ